MSRTGLTARPRRQDTSSWTQLNEARSFLPLSVRFASTRCSMTERRSGVSSFRQPHALRWLARQRVCGLKPESWRARQTGSVRLRSKNSVALGGDGGALAGVRGPGVVDQSPANHMKNAEPENEGDYQGLCAQSPQANELSAGWPCVNPAGDPELRDFLGYFTSDVLVQKMWVAANNLYRLAAS